MVFYASSILLVFFALIHGGGCSFHGRRQVWCGLAWQQQAHCSSTSTSSTRARTKLFVAGQGFGDNNNSQSSPSSSSPAKTYGPSALRPIRDLIDAESAMRAFFTSREEWLPLFRSMISSSPSSSCAAMDFLGKQDSSTSGRAALTSQSTIEYEKIDFHETSSPWRLLQAIPDQADHRAILAAFLDGAQNSLLSIPTDERVEEDDNDVQFVEEGRRLLALSRFHVLQANDRGSGSGRMETYDHLFATCWSELHHLCSQNVAHTGSLIILPDYQISDLRRFTDMNVLRPLEWLGLHDDFEVASIHHGTQNSSPAIRLLYKLSDIPEVQDQEQEEPSNDE
jgi:hypothetical protein